MLLKLLAASTKHKQNTSTANEQIDTNLSDCCEGLLGSTTLEECLTLAWVSGTSWGLFWNSVSCTMPNGQLP